MKKNKKSSLIKVRSLLIAVAVVTLFVLPAVASLQWAKGVLGLDSSRNTVDSGSFISRPYDNNLGEVDPFNEPIISVTFDDGWESAYSEGLPVMQRYGIKSTQFILAESFDDPSYVSVGQVESFIDAGHEIASHSVTHADLTALDDAGLNYEVAESKAILSKKFPITNDFASPLGTFNDRTIEQIKKSYRSARNTEADLKNGVYDADANTKNNFDRYNINAFTVRSDTTLEELKNYVEYAKANNAWIVITYHQIDNSGSLYSVTPENFENQMKLLYDAEIRSAPLGKVMDAIDGKNYVPEY